MTGVPGRPEPTPAATARRLWALEATTLKTDASRLVVGAEGEIRMPMPCFVIEHERALVLFDTGLHPLAQEDPKSYWGDLFEVLNPSVSADMTIDRQLAKLGFAVSDVTHVVLSHTHHDHTGALFRFPHARFFIGPREWDFGMDPPPESRRFFRVDTELLPTRGFDWTVAGPVHDLLGDRSITVLHTPGHTPGELALVVQLPSQRLILTGDTTHLRGGLATSAPDPFDWDLDLAIRSLGVLQRLQADGAHVWIAHDPEDWDHYRPLVAHT